MIKIIGKRIAYGDEPEFLTAPILNLPSDALSVRRIVRSNSVAKIAVRTERGIAMHYAEITAGGLRLDALVGANKRDAL